MKKKGMLWVILGIVVVLCGASWLGYRYLILVNQAKSYVTIDINPSVEFAVNIDDEVVDVIALNNDADIITSDLDLIGLSVEEATDAVINAAIETGYIDELSEDNTVVVTSASEDEETRTKLEKTVVDSVNASLDNKKIFALVAAQGVDDAIKADAEKYDVSNGKMLLINRAILLNSTLNIDDLVNSSIQDIQREIKEVVQNKYKEADMSQEQLKKQWKEQKQTKIKATNQAKKEKREQIWNEKKGQNSTATESEKEEIINEVIDQQKTQIKENLDSVKEEIQQGTGQGQTDNQNGGSYPVIENGNQIQQEIQKRQGR